MSKARSLSKLINKDTYIARFGESSVTDLAPTETDVASSISSNPIPAFVGMIGAFSMATTTEWKTANRWIICDGSPVSRTAYNHLFDVIGTTWGVGDGSSTFNLPDLRGEFLRGYDDGHGNDGTSGRTFGSSQAAAIKSHNWHLFGRQHSGGNTVVGDSNIPWGDTIGYGNAKFVIRHTGYPVAYGGNNPMLYVNNNGGYTTVGIGNHNLWVSIGNPYGSTYYGPGNGANALDNAINQIGNGEETRPRNITVQYCIKY